MNLAESVGFALEFDLAVKKIRPWGVADKGAAAAAAGEIDRSSLLKLRIKVLRKMLRTMHGDDCSGCLEKEQFIDRILDLTSAAEKEKSAKDEL